jgi:enamine deaminase RidA (YjgF/YER057c/UK114 family)
MQGRVAGSTFSAAGVRYCRLGGLTQDDITATRTIQTRAVFDQMQTALRAVDMDFSNVVRTWFYNDKMLEWYAEFNAVRTAFFKEHGVFDGLVPASTGIGGRNGAGAALTGGLLAVQAVGRAAPATVVPSPLQCPAPVYGSSFSRAVEVATPGVRRLFVSGSASIDAEGNSVHLDDIDAQMTLTFQVVQAILESRGMGWHDLTRAIAYFKHHGDASRMAGFCRAHGIPTAPFLLSNNDICRDDLLFEIEVDATAGGRERG